MLGATFFHFIDAYEYQFEVVVENMTNSTYVDLEYVFFEYHNMGGVQCSFIHEFTDDRYGNDAGAGVPIIEGIIWQATTDGSGSIDAYLTPQQYATDGTSMGGVLKAEFNSIYYGGTITYDTADTTVGIRTTFVADYDGYGGYTPRVRVNGLSASAPYTFYTFLFGFQNPWTVSK